LNTLDEMVPVLSVAFVPVLVTFLFEQYYSTFRYMDCPCCGEYMQVRMDWECKECGRKQGEERLLIDRCLHCGSRAALLICGKCEGEMRL
jgi:hypothetical protein